MDTTIRGLQKHFEWMYNLRNFLVNGPYSERSTHMHNRIGKIVDAKRKNERMAGRLSRATSYFMSCVNYFGGFVDLQNGMMEKFPPYGCLYCSHMPCDCNDAKRPTPTEFKRHDEQRIWTIRQWQEHLFKVYGHRNMNNFHKVHCRLSSEFAELDKIMCRGPGTPILPADAIKECERECADVFSWILTLAYVEGVDLESAIAERYSVCPGCKKLPCNCPLVYISPDGKTFSTVGYPGIYE